MVPRDAVFVTPGPQPELDRSYRRVDGYSIKQKLRAVRERARSVGGCAARWRWPTTSWCSATASRSGPASHRCSRRTWRCPRSPRTRSATRGAVLAARSLAARERGRRRADALAFDRPPEAFRRAAVRAPRGDWGEEIARRGLYELADAVRLEALGTSGPGARGPRGRRSTARRSTTSSTPGPGSTGCPHRRGGLGSTSRRRALAVRARPLRARAEDALGRGVEAPSSRRCTTSSRSGGEGRQAAAESATGRARRAAARR